MDWTTGSAYIKSSPLLVVLVEYRYHSFCIQYMYYFNNEFANGHYQKKVQIVEIVLLILYTIIDSLS